MAPGKSFTKDEIALHNSRNSCWVIIEEKVYDLTSFIDEHPGGADIVLKWAGKDGTKAFDNAGHSDDAVELSEDYVIGTISDGPSTKPNGNNNFVSVVNLSDSNGHESIPMTSRVFTLEEIAKHDSRQSAWVIINNSVYDVTSFLDEHPGGADIVLKWAGKDGTKAFDNANHSDDAVELSEDYKIGTVATSGTTTTSILQMNVGNGGMTNGSPSENGNSDGKYWARFTPQQVAMHSSKESAWIILNKEVYDVTDFIDEHPGGGDIILKWAGQDGTEGFENAGHSDDAIQLSEDYKIGVLDENSSLSSQPAPVLAAQVKSENVKKPTITYDDQKPGTEEICWFCPQCCFIQ